MIQISTPPVGVRHDKPVGVYKPVGVSKPVIVLHGPCSSLTLRPPSLRDASDIARAITLRVARQIAGLVTPYLDLAAEFWILGEAFRIRRGRGRGQNWIIEVQDELVGACEVSYANAKTIPEIGYWLAETAWGRGYATEAVKATLGTLRGPVRACVYADNPASRRVLEKAGFVLKAESVTFCLERGAWVSTQGFECA